MAAAATAPAPVVTRSCRYKGRLQEFADETGLEMTVCHYPPGTSKWNPIEHRLFSQISATWSGFVLRTVAIVLGPSSTVRF